MSACAQRTLRLLVQHLDPQHESALTQCAHAASDAGHFDAGARVAEFPPRSGGQSNENKKLQARSLSEERPMRGRFQMSRATPQMRDFAERLIAHETRTNKSSETKTPAALHVSEKLGPHLMALLGNTGFCALLSRALALANAEVPLLRAVHVKSDGSLEGLDELKAQVDPEELLEGRVVLLAQLLGLLVAFIGEDLTLRLVHDIWPKLSLNDLDFGKGGKDEKTK